MISGDGIYGRAEKANRGSYRSESKQRRSTDDLPNLPYNQVVHWTGYGKTCSSRQSQHYRPSRPLVPADSNPVFKLRKYSIVKCVHVGFSRNPRNTAGNSRTITRDKSGWKWLTNSSNAGVTPLLSLSPFSTREGASSCLQ
jgi:hypothetical protein